MQNNLSVPALLVTDSVNQRYFHRLEYTPGAVYVTAGRTVYLTWAALRPLPEDVSGREIRQEEFGQAAASLLEEDGIPSLTVEPDIPLSLYRLLTEAGVDIHVAEGGSPVADMREIKSAWELEQLQRACDITDHAFSEILDKLRPGITELEVAAELEKTMRLDGCDGFNKTIVAAGLHSAKPHHWPTDYQLQVGDFVTMDYGCTVAGYHSDMTRTVVIGKATDKQKKIYDTVLQAQLAGLAALRAGKTGGEIDAVARDMIDATEFRGSFLHGLGHGIGLDIHEGTGLAKGSPAVLKAGMVVSVEPGIYLEGYGGVRIEDIAVVGESSSLPLEHSDKSLLELI